MFLKAGALCESSTNENTANYRKTSQSTGMTRNAKRERRWQKNKFFREMMMFMFNLAGLHGFYQAFNNEHFRVALLNYFCKKNLKLAHLMVL